MEFSVLAGEGGNELVCKERESDRGERVSN